MKANPYLCLYNRFPQPSYFYPYPAPYYGVYPSDMYHVGHGIGIHAGGQFGGDYGAGIHVGGHLGGDHVIGFDAGGHLTVVNSISSLVDTRVIPVMENGSEKEKSYRLLVACFFF